MALKEHWQSLSQQQQLIALSCLCLFLPFYMTCILHLCILLYAFVKGDLQVAYRKTRASKYGLLFCLLTFFVSLFYNNMMGILCTLATVIIFSMIIYYQYYATKEFLLILMKLFVFMSILCAIYGLMEYNGILDTLGVEDFAVIVMDQPNVRLNSVFFNANYYAMMIEFFVLMASWLLLHEHNHLHGFYYLFVIILNLFMLYLSGCRTAWPSLALGIFVLLLFHHDRRLLVSFFLAIGLGLVAFCFFPWIFPRADSIMKYFWTRTEIWQVALQNIKTHSLFGQGPLTYMLVCNQYPDANITQHAHSIFIDPILSFGIVGVAVIFPYFKARIDEWKKVKINDFPRTLMMAFLATTLCHGLLDYTVYFIPTGFTFLMIFGSTFPNENKSQKDSLK